MMYAEQLITVARQNNDRLQEARIVYAQSSKTQKSGDTDKALAFARQSLKLTSTADTNTYTKASTMIAYMLAKQGNDVEALKVAFKILRETENRGWKKQTVYCLACIADLYRGIKKVKEALPYALRASEGALSVRDSGLYIFAISTLSNLYSDRSIRSAANMKKATQYLETILAAPYLKILSYSDKARYMGNLGRLYVNSNDPRAEATLQQSIAISHEEGYVELEKQALNELMSLSKNKGNYALAVKYGEQALAAGPAAKASKVLQRNIFNNLSQAYEGVKNYKEALNYYQKATFIGDSILALDKANDATELDEKYKADKRLLVAAGETKLLHQQRNFIIILAALLLLASIATYRWLIYKRNKQTLLLAQEHAQLAKLDALKTRFFANVSHELRTPLTLIMGPANQLLNKEVKDEEQQQAYLFNIARNSKKLLNIVNELLDLGKLEAGKLTVRLKNVTLVPFVKVIYQAFSSAADIKQINYQLVCDIQEPLLVQLDQERFEKICNNLISNAIKFTPNGGTVTITATTAAGTMKFSVNNTGQGIHPDDMPHIFDRYYQGYRSNQSLEGGTGIGLAIAREFAELMGGSLTIDNRWGEGSTFIVSIPLVMAWQQQATKPADGTLANDLSKQAVANHKPLVMVVEDNSEMCAYITSILQPTYTLITAGNGIEALNILNSMASLPALIISDVMMPQMDGFTLLETLKQHDTYCTVPVIMLTALADNQHKLKALNIGVDDYLTKPFLNNELIARATNLINNAAARRIPVNETEDDVLLNTNTNEATLIAEHYEETSYLPTSPADLAWLTDLEALVRKHTGKTDLNLAMLSYEIGISERQLFRRIKDITGLTPNKYIRIIRLQIAREAIDSGKYRTISEISYAAGFDTPAYFSKLFKEHYGREVNDML